ncbi:phospholipid scramblase 1 isoform X4 [Hydra vulgaris]|uniref:Phospholipid scramblase n=1 Tax=Hydra vulgaris TaxID=6087 RepID=A0ABM4B5T9_HYDVU
MDHPLQPAGQYQQVPANYPPPQPYFQQPGYGPPPAAQYAAPGYQQYGAPGGYQQPIMQQPGEQWMAFPHAPPPGCPPGLEYLMQIDQLLVKQQVELLEVMTGFETANKYKVKNSLGQNVYFAAEDTDCCTRQCCGPSRPFDIKILDNNNQEVIHLNRPLRCAACCFPCCLQELEVTSPPGTVIGYVIQKWAFCGSLFEICDALKQPVLRIEGPICAMSMCGDVEFKVMSLDGSSQVGRISKQWSGLLKEAFTDADTFGITFPIDLDVKIKAVMLGACFLIDFMFFETSNQNDHHHH